ncbi:unnamed protein product [Cyprideis torosa]|uniref:Uncharacterized protein n=1 Tax=Cyprideis torosa TaxID=163714 RepID=A0A7R8ZGF8_9CRUS|nr:unnamed protein product [Cyprideis torosa]CAG0881553.1 unnamed protein product [Cyprideis torosa]
MLKRIRMIAASLEHNAVIMFMLALSTYFFLMDASFFAAIHLGVLMFLFRDFLDNFDGALARAISHTSVLNDYSSTGYYFDGIMDACGILALFCGGSMPMMTSIMTFSHYQLGVLMFLFRDFLDNFDGALARAISHTSVLNDYSSTGYYFDGIMDACGILALFCACLIFLRKWIHRNGAYTILGQDSEKVTNNGVQSGAYVAHKRALILCACYGLQEFLVLVQFAGFAVYGVLITVTELHLGQSQQIIYG